MRSTRLMASLTSLACTLILVPAVALEAQRPPAIAQRPRQKPAASTADAPTKRRFWAGIGVAKGAASMSCDVCRGERETALAGTVSFGGVARSRIGSAATRQLHAPR